MTSVALAWSAAWILTAAAAGIRLWRASTGREPFVKSGYRWLAAGALCLGVGGAVQQTFGGLIGGASPLRVADLISLSALPAIVIGLATITADRSGGDRSGIEPSRWRLFQDRAARSASGRSRSSVKAAAGPAAFTLDLLRPLADLAARSWNSRQRLGSMPLRSPPDRSAVIV